MAGEVMGDVMIGDVISDAIILTVRRALLSAARRRSSPVAVAIWFRFRQNLSTEEVNPERTVPPDEVYNNGVHSCVRR